MVTACEKEKKNKFYYRHEDIYLFIYFPDSGRTRRKINTTSSTRIFIYFPDSGRTKGSNGGWGGSTQYHAWSQSYDDRPSHPYNAVTEHVGFSPTRPTLLAKRREVLSESHEG